MTGHKSLLRSNVRKRRKRSTVVMRNLGGLEVLLCSNFGCHHITVSDTWKTFRFLDVGFPIRKMRIHLFWRVVEEWDYYENVGTFITASFY